MYALKISDHFKYSKCGIKNDASLQPLGNNFLLAAKGLTLTRPWRRKSRIRWFFDVSKVKESSFSYSNLTDHPQIFNAHLLENTNLSPSSFHFSVGFISRSYFESDGFIAHPNE